MSNLFPSFRPPQQNDMSRKHSLNIIRKKTIERADGSNELHERSLDYSTNTHAKGHDWLSGSKKNRMPNEDHFRQDSSQITVRDKTIIDDGMGNRITEENAFQLGNDSSTSGTLLIGNKRETKTDERGLLFNKFNSSSSSLTFFNNSSSKLLK